MKYKHILLVDDNLADQRLFLSAIKKEKHRFIVSTVNNGQEALARLKINNVALPDLIVLDLHMPIMCGLQCLRELKNDPNLKQIPVVVFSTSTDPNEISQVHQLSGNGIVTKPVDLEKYFSTVREILEDSPKKGTR